MHCSMCVKMTAAELQHSTLPCYIGNIECLAWSQVFPLILPVMTPRLLCCSCPDAPYGGCVMELCCAMVSAWLLSNHHSDKLFIVHLTIAIDVRFADHLIHLLICQLLAQVGHDVPQLHVGA